jgi:hypothetical protein
MMIYDYPDRHRFRMPILCRRTVEPGRRDVPEFLILILILIHRTHARTRAWRSTDQPPAFFIFSSHFLFSWILLPKRTRGKSAPIRT